MRPTPATLLILTAACATPAEPVEVDHGFETPGDWTTADTDPGPVRDLWWRELGDDALAGIVDEALLHNHDLRAAAARVEAAAAQAVMSGADLWPQLDATFDAGRRRQNFIGFPIPGSPGSVLSSTSTNFGVNLNLSWELDLWGRIRAGERAATADLAAAAADLTAARLSLIAQVTKAWFAVAEARRQVALSERTVASHRDTVDEVRDRYARGIRPALDLRQARTNLADAEATLAARQEQLERATRQLEILAGRYPEGSAAQTDALPTELPPVPAGLPGELLQRRPDLVAAERRLAAAGARTDRARAALYPRLSLTGSTGTASDELEDLTDTDLRVWSLGANLLQPLFQGGRLRADVARNEALMREAAADYSGAVLRAFSEVETALAAEQRTVTRERHRRTAAEEARAALELALDRYRRGLVGFLTVADAQRQALLQESLWLTARRERLDARTDLHLALGGGFPPPRAATDEESPR